jgi:tetratricopeptide (TPR) repeat protein
VTQDTYWGPDRSVSYQVIDDDWRAFNRVFMVVYPLDQAETVEALLGPDLDLDFNRQRAIETAQAEIAADGGDGYAWANLGANLVYFERYAEAAEAYDTALARGLPWRFTRHHFGLYHAYYNVGKAEEARLWHGWASFQMGDALTAIEDFREALRVNPNYLDALYGLDFLGASP